MHMLQSLKVFHAPGKIHDKKTGLSFSWALGNLSNPKGPQPSPAIKRWLDNACKGKEPEETQVKFLKHDGIAEKYDHLHPSISCHLPQNSSPYLCLRLVLFLEGPLIWHYIILLWLTLSSLVLLTQFNLLKSVHFSHLWHN